MKQTVNYNLWVFGVGEFKSDAIPTKNQTGSKLAETGLV